MHSMYVDSNENRILCADTDYIKSNDRCIKSCELDLVEYRKIPIVIEYNKYNHIPLMVCDKCREEFLFKKLIDLQETVNYLQEKLN